MAAFSSLTVDLDTDQLQGMKLSLASITKVFAAFDGLGDGVSDRLSGVTERFFPGLAVGGDNARDFFLIQGANKSTSGTLKLQPVQILPSNRFLEFVAALASEAEANVSTRHGWPILSLGDRTPSVTGSGGGSNPAAVEGRP